MLAVGWVLVNDTRVSIRERVEAAMRVTVQLLDTVIVSSAMNPSFGPTHIVMQDFLRSLGYVRSSHIELYDHAGNPLYISPESTFKSDVVPPDWFVKLVAPEKESVQRRIRYGTLIVTSSPDGSIREAWSGFQQLILIAVGFFVILNLMVYALLSHSLRPVRHILNAINRVELGDLTVKLPDFKLPEFDKIGHSLNRMVAFLGAEKQLEENRQLTHLIQKHIEEERRSLARELHDELGQYVTAIKTFAVAIANKTKERAPDVEASAQTIVAAANHIYDGMHNIIRQLRPGSLDNLGLSETIRDLINSYQQQHPDLKIDLMLSGELNKLGENININVFRIVQESINNVIKHADAKHIQITLEINAQGGLALNIHDDGKGMEISHVDQTNHFGLLGMRERVQGLHGQFNVISSLEKKSGGTTISIVIPKALNN
jgi:two-component system sensor histidine kinase UhpB